MKRKSNIAAGLADSLELDALASKPGADGSIGFRAFLESPDFCGLALSDAIAAIADASEGVRPSITEELCSKMFRCSLGELPGRPRRIVVVGAGGRSGKTTRCLAPKAIHAAWSVPLPTLAEGEVAVPLLVAPKRRLAEQSFAVVKGLIARSPLLSRSVVDEKGKTITLKRPDGKLCRIEVGTANRGGQDARGYTLVFVGMDEAAFFYADDGYTVTDSDLFDAAIQRVVPGGQIWIVSTPWIEGVGVMEGFISTDWGAHQNALVTARLGTRLLNPTWDPDGLIEAAIRQKPGGNETADREILALPIAKGATSFFDPIAIRAALGRSAEGPIEDSAAGADFGHTNDCSGLAIGHRHAVGMFSISRVREIMSSPDQRPSETYRAFALEIVARGLFVLTADGHYKEAVKEELYKHGVSFDEAATCNEFKTKTYKAVKTLLAEGRLCLADLPPEDRERLAEQLRSIVVRPLDGGRIKISAPRQRLSDVLGGAQAGGHADVVSALVLALYKVGSCDQYLWQERAEQARLPPEVAPPDSPFRFSDATAEEDFRFSAGSVSAWDY